MRKGLKALMWLVSSIVLSLAFACANNEIDCPDNNCNPVCQTDYCEDVTTPVVNGPTVKAYKDEIDYEGFTNDQTTKLNVMGFYLENTWNDWMDLNVLRFDVYEAQSDANYCRLDWEVAGEWYQFALGFIAPEGTVTFTSTTHRIMPDQGIHLLLSCEIYSAEEDGYLQANLNQVMVSGEFDEYVIEGTESVYERIYFGASFQSFNLFASTAPESPNGLVAVDPGDNISVELLRFTLVHYRTEGFNFYGTTFRLDYDPSKMDIGFCHMDEILDEQGTRRWMTNYSSLNGSTLGILASDNLDAWETKTYSLSCDMSNVQEYSQLYVSLQKLGTPYFDGRFVLYNGTYNLLSFEHVQLTPVYTELNIMSPSGGYITLDYDVEVLRFDIANYTDKVLTPNNINFQIENHMTAIPTCRLKLYSTGQQLGSDAANNCDQWGCDDTYNFDLPVEDQIPIGPNSRQTYSLSCDLLGAAQGAAFYAHLYSLSTVEPSQLMTFVSGHYLYFP